MQIFMGNCKLSFAFITSRDIIEAIFEIFFFFCETWSLNFFLNTCYGVLRAHHLEKSELSCLESSLNKLIRNEEILKRAGAKIVKIKSAHAICAEQLIRNTEKYKLLKRSNLDQKSLNFSSRAQ